MELDTLRDLYIEELKDLYSAEKQLVKALPKMAREATNAGLAAAFTNHLRQTEGHVERLEQVFEILGVSPRGKKCIGMEGLIEEGKELISEKPEADVLDAGLISKAQHVEHYEIAGYGTCRTYAQLLGEDEQARLLQETLDEEKEADKLLTQLAEASINIDAAVAQVGEAESARTSRERSKSSEREVSRSASVETSRKAGGSKRRGTSRARDEEASAY